MLCLVPGVEVEGQQPVGKEPRESRQPLQALLVCSPRLSWAASIGCPPPTNL